MTYKLRVIEKGFSGAGREGFAKDLLVRNLTTPDYVGSEAAESAARQLLERIPEMVLAVTVDLKRFSTTPHILEQIL